MFDEVKLYNDVPIDVKRSEDNKNFKGIVWNSNTQNNSINWLIDFKYNFFITNKTNKSKLTDFEEICWLFPKNSTDKDNTSKTEIFSNIWISKKVEKEE